MDKQIIQDALTVHAFSHIDDIQVFDELDSTNLESLRQIKSRKPATRLIVAKAQSAGRGRRGRCWLSPSGSGIYLSLTRSFESVETIQSLSLISAISVLNALESAGVSGLHLKWPNDVLFEEQKLAGVLLELHVGRATNDVVFGIGINLSLSDQQKRSIGRPVTDVRSIIGHRPDDSIMAAEIANLLMENILIFEDQGFRPFSEIWNSYDCCVNQDIVIQAGNARKVGKSMGVDESGALILQLWNRRELITGGEIFPSLRKI